MLGVVHCDCCQWLRGLQPQTKYYLEPTVAVRAASSPVYLPFIYVGFVIFNGKYRFNRGQSCQVENIGCYLTAQANFSLIINFTALAAFARTS